MDIMMCKFGCSKQETCLRFKGEVNPFGQSYFFDSPLKDGECKYYYEIKEDTPLTEKEEMDLFFKHIRKIYKIKNK
jgi:hypothetical protein